MYPVISRLLNVYQLNNIWLTCINLLLWQSYYFNGYYQQQLNEQQIQINQLRNTLIAREKELDYLKKQLSRQEHQMTMDEDNEIIEIGDNIPEQEMD
jgi:hypothetical protein